MAENKNRPLGFLQLAGGTNSYTIEALKRIGLFQTTSIPDCTTESANITMPFEAGKQIYTDALIAGVAYGGYAQKVVGRVLHKIGRNVKLQANACTSMRQMCCPISLCVTWRTPATIKTTKANIASPFPYVWYAGRCTGCRRGLGGGFLKVFKQLKLEHPLSPHAPSHLSPRLHVVCKRGRGSFQVQPLFVCGKVRINNSINCFQLM